MFANSAPAAMTKGHASCNTGYADGKPTGYQLDALTDVHRRNR